MLKRSIALIPSRRELYQAKLVFYLLMASLSMFFLAGVVSYCVIRSQAFQPIQHDYYPLSIPLAFWISTLMLIFVSLLLHRACQSVRREKQLPFRRALIGAIIAATGFMVTQFIGMYQLLSVHLQYDDGTTKAYGLCFTLSALHGLHVAIGLGFLGYVFWQSCRNRYDHERHHAVEHCAGYWHFLDGVWLVMLAAFVVAG